MNDKMRKLVTEYNQQIDNLLCQIATLKLNPDAETLSVQSLQVLRGCFSVLTSHNQRKKIEDALQKVYDAHTLYLQEEVERLSSESQT